MTPDQYVAFVAKLRGLGATRILVTADGEYEAEFAPSIPAADETQEDPDLLRIERERLLFASSG